MRWLSCATRFHSSNASLAEAHEQRLDLGFVRVARVHLEAQRRAADQLLWPCRVPLSRSLLAIAVQTARK